MKYCYETKQFSESTLEVIDAANDIIEEFEGMDLVLTLRQLYYQFVSRAQLKNKQSEYKRLGGIIKNARLAGLIDWAAIEDRTRQPVLWQHTEDAEEAVNTLAGAVQKDRWHDQDVAVEVWIEKDALTGVIRKPCAALDVPYFACKGYNSSSAAYRAGQRILRRDKPTIILHLGDHDPSGIDMTLDNQKRFDMFTNGKAVVKRIALNMDQIEQYDPPPNPAKMTDSRAKKYVDEFGYDSWELDALNPNDMQELLEKEISSYINHAKWVDTREAEDKENYLLDSLIDNWDSVKDELLLK